MSITHWETSAIARDKRGKRKVEILKEKRLEPRAYSLLEKLTAREPAGEVFDAYKNNNSLPPSMLS